MCRPLRIHTNKESDHDHVYFDYMISVSISGYVKLRSIFSQ